MITHRNKLGNLVKCVPEVYLTKLNDYQQEEIEEIMQLFC